MTKNKKDTKIRAIESFSSIRPNTILIDLMITFSPETVVKFIELFGGERIYIPSWKRIWSAYRDAVIVQSLSLKNNKENRQWLAKNFGLPTYKISNIFNTIKFRKRFPVTKETIMRVLGRIFRQKRNELRHLFRHTNKVYSAFKDGDVGQILESKHLSMDDRVFVREAIKKTFDECKEEIEVFLIRVKKEEFLPEAIAKMKHMFVEEFGVEV